MELTRRGRVVLAVTVGAFLLGAVFGARSLNAVVVPGAVALLAAYAQVRGREEVTVDRETPPDDFAGATHELTMRFADLDAESVARPFVGAVHDEVDDGLYAPQQRFETTVGAEPVTYEVTYEERGERRFGPATVIARDAFGLLEREFEVLGTDGVLVYPRVYRLTGWGVRNLYGLEEQGRSRERDEFERLREYERGDSLRDIHWPTTAKRDELIVKEFSAEAEAESVTLAAAARDGGADAMAEAVASIVLALYEEGVPCHVTVPFGAVDVGPERGGRVELLELLARVNQGRLRDPEADIVVTADGDHVTVTAGDREFTFAELTGDRATTPRDVGGVPA